MSIKNSESLFEVQTEIRVRFSEVDSMGVVWHGNYLKYFEDGREAFGRKHGLAYLDFFKNNILTPLVSIECNYKLPLIYGDAAIIYTKYIDCEAAKLLFEYKILKKDTNETIVTAKSTQVFLNSNRELMLTFPDFFIEWKRKMGIYTK